MGVYAQIRSGADLSTDSSTHASSSTDGMVRVPSGTLRIRRALRVASRYPQPSSRFFDGLFVKGHVMKRIAILVSVAVLVGLGLIIALAPTPRAGAQTGVAAINEADAAAK